MLPDNWVRDSAAVSDPFRRRRIEAAPGDEQGRHFWLNRTVPEAGIAARPWPDAPVDAFAARGHWGQSVTVVPSLDLVVVRTADDRAADALDFNRFLALAIAVAR
jgi:CubicO group peptidase (beta-lactamase class C family)